MATRFTVWLKEYQKLAREVQDIPLINIKEVLSVGGQHFVLSMGKENTILNDKQEIDPKYMRTYFTNFKEEFDDVLEILRTRVKEQREFAINICNALTEAAVPEVVMARLQGEQVSGDAFDMLRLGTKKKLEELMKIALKIKTPFESFTIGLPVAGRQLYWDCGIISSIKWVASNDEISISFSSGSSDDYKLSGLEDDMFFLTNYQFIEDALRELGTKISNVLVDGKNYPN